MFFNYLISGPLYDKKKPKRAYGWSHPEGADDKGERFVAVLEIPPVDSQQTAVKMAIYSDVRQGEITQRNL
jgi:hypothetical protein